jgi:hypothetical protein
MMVMMESHPSEAGNETPAVTNGEDADFDISVMEESEVKKVCDQNKYAKECADGCYLPVSPTRDQDQECFQEGQREGTLPFDIHSQLL